MWENLRLCTSIVGVTIGGGVKSTDVLYDGVTGAVYFSVDVGTYPRYFWAFLMVVSATTPSSASVDNEVGIDEFNKPDVSSA